MIIDLNDPTFTPPPPRVRTAAERLREYIDAFAGQMETEFKSDMVGRALMVAGADVVLRADGMPASIWAIQRCENALAGRWTKETTDLIISTPNR